MPPLLPLLVTAVLLQAAPGDTLFVQASALNLRAKPKASATLLTQVPIGTACAVVSVVKDGWAELKCLNETGFGKLDLLGSNPPDHAQLLAQAQEPGRPLPEALNLLQRAVTLKPSDEPTRTAFRELFWKAEFDRLARARAASDLMKAPQEWRFPAGSSSDMDECVRKSIQPDPESEVAWEEARVQGTDMVLARLFTDGTFVVSSGAIDTEKSTVTVQLESRTEPSKAVREALGAHDLPDACQPQGSEGASCGIVYDQNCGPDDCWDPYQSCREDAGKSCQGCKRTCASTCTDCRTACGPQNHRACVARCLKATRTCEEKCQDAVAGEEKSCEADYNTCSAEAEREWNRTCQGPCDRVYACVERCQKKPGMDQWKCVDRCDDRLPQSCSSRCLFKYQ